MTHMPGVPMKFDPPVDWRLTDRVTCLKCGAHPVMYRTHESSCGGHEDDEFKCEGCGHSWWVDGIDA
jgi:DNA-directed RNA polymerase subunit M/transcription elongation factor TFIIS